MRQKTIHINKYANLVINTVKDVKMGMIKNGLANPQEIQKACQLLSKSLQIPVPIVIEIFKAA